MKLHYLPLIFLLVSFSCNNQSHNTESSSPDSLQKQQPWSLVINDTLLKENNHLPSAFLLKNILPGKKEELWEVMEFLHIDSLKKENKYNAYLDQLDIGQLKDANAWIYDTLLFESNTAILWGVTYSSYDACPYFSGKSVYLTSFSPDGKAIATLKILNNSNSADAPLFLYTIGECKIESTGLILCLDSIVNGDQGEEEDGKEFEEIIKETESRKYQVSSSGAINEVERKKSEAKKEKKYLDL